MHTKLGEWKQTYKAVQIWYPEPKVFAVVTDTDDGKQAHHVKQKMAAVRTDSGKLLYILVLWA